jgi:hypothetical protein
MTEAGASLLEGDCAARPQSRGSVRKAATVAGGRSARRRFASPVFPFQLNRIADLPPGLR